MSGLEITFQIAGILLATVVTLELIFIIFLKVKMSQAVELLAVMPQLNIHMDTVNGHLANINVAFYQVYQLMSTLAGSLPGQAIQETVKIGEKAMKAMMKPENMLITMMMNKMNPGSAPTIMDMLGMMGGPMAQTVGGIVKDKVMGTDEGDPEEAIPVE